MLSGDNERPSDVYGMKVIFLRIKTNGKTYQGVFIELISLPLHLKPDIESLTHMNTFPPFLLFNKLYKTKKNVILFREIGRVKIFSSPTRPRKSNVYENTYKNSLANLLVQTYVFSFQTIKDSALCFLTKKSSVRVAF